MKKPTILLITTDEQHRETLESFGAKALKTPHMDSIGREGISFKRAYTASPVCLPARCSLATGLYPHSSRSCSNHTGASLNPTLPNIFNLFRKAGYRTSLHGKGHFTPCPYPLTDPEITRDLAAVKPFYHSLGIDHIDLQDDKNNSLWFYDDYSEDLERKGLLADCRAGRAGRKNKHTAGHFFTGPADMHPDAWVGRKALDYLDKVDGDESCMMWVSFSGPHYPIDTPREYYEKVDMEKDISRVIDEYEKDDRSGYHSYHGPGGTEGSGHAKDGAQKNYSEEYWREWRRMYYGNVVLIDDYVGRILEAADAKWGDDLMVVFTTDHGDMMGNHGMWGKNGASCEDVTHVPLMMRLPGGKKGQMGLVGLGEDSLISHLDILPTVLEAAGLSRPEAGEGLSLLSHKEKAGERSYLLSECDGRIIIQTKEDIKFIRVKKRYGKGSGAIEKEYYELYDLNSDPHELVNLWDNPAYNRQQTRCREIYEKHSREVEGVLFYDPKAPDAGVPPWFIG